jgi:hypothetical protein
MINNKGVSMVFEIIKPEWLVRDVAKVIASSKDDAFRTYISLLKSHLDEWNDEVTEDQLDDFIGVIK